MEHASSMDRRTIAHITANLKMIASTKWTYIKKKFTLQSSITVNVGVVQYFMALVQSLLFHILAQFTLSGVNIIEIEKFPMPLATGL